MMEFSFFIGCQIPARLNHYESSARAILKRLGIGLIDIKEFNCCGYPMRNIDFKVFLLSSARNLALAEKRNLNILTLCKCCFGTLKKADYLLKENPHLKDEVNKILKKEGLKYEAKSEIKHLLTILYQDVGLDNLKEKITNIYHDLPIANHYGCHILRPSKVVEFDDPVKPRIFDELVEITGAKSIEWRMKLECCGAPLLGINDGLSIDLTYKKLRNTIELGAEFICTACPYCQIQFDKVQDMIIHQKNLNRSIPSILYTQLIGLCMGISWKDLGLDMNEIKITGLKDKLFDSKLELKEEDKNKDESK